MHLHTRINSSRMGDRIIFLPGYRRNWIPILRMHVRECVDIRNYGTVNLAALPAGILFARAYIRTWYMRSPKFRLIRHRVRAGCVQFEYASWLAHDCLRNPRGIIQWDSVVLIALPAPFISVISFTRISLIISVCYIAMRESFRQLIQRAIHESQ